MPSAQPPPDPLPRHNSRRANGPPPPFPPYSSRVFVPPKYHTISYDDRHRIRHLYDPTSNLLRKKFAPVIDLSHSITPLEIENHWHFSGPSLEHIWYNYTFTATVNFSPSPEPSHTEIFPLPGSSPFSQYSLGAECHALVMILLRLYKPQDVYAGLGMGDIERVIIRTKCKELVKELSEKVWEYVKKGWKRHKSTGVEVPHAWSLRETHQALREFERITGVRVVFWLIDEGENGPPGGAVVEQGAVVRSESS